MGRKGPLGREDLTDLMQIRIIDVNVFVGVYCMVTINGSSPSSS